MCMPSSSRLADSYLTDSHGSRDTAKTTHAHTCISDVWSQLGVWAGWWYEGLHECLAMRGLQQDRGSQPCCSTAHHRSQTLTNRLPERDALTTRWRVCRPAARRAGSCRAQRRGALVATLLAGTVLQTDLLSQASEVQLDADWATKDSRCAPGHGSTQPQCPRPASCRGPG